MAKARTKSADVTEASVVAYKAFNADWSCLGFKYEIGKTYEHTGDVSLCASGFHACTVPFDCWEHYPGATSLAKVTLAGVSDQREHDSKLVAAKITRKGLFVDWHAVIRKSEPDDSPAWRMANALKYWCESDQQAFHLDSPLSAMVSHEIR